jgi:hypothetical protein
MITVASSGYYNKFMFLQKHLSSKTAKWFGIWVSSVCLVLFCLGNLRFSSGSRSCEKCFLSGSYFKISFMTIPLWNSENASYRGTDHLKAMQQHCKHRYRSYGSSRSGTLLGRTRIGDGVGSGNNQRAWFVEQPGGWDRIFFELEAIRENLPHDLRFDSSYKLSHQKQEDDWAWFIQQATGKDFSITFDEENVCPIVPKGTADKILTWWKKEGKIQFVKP